MTGEEPTHAIWSRVDGTVLVRRDGMAMGPGVHPATEEVGWTVTCHGQPVAFVPAATAPTQRIAAREVNTAYPMPAWVPPWGEGAPTGEIALIEGDPGGESGVWSGPLVRVAYLGDAPFAQVLTLGSPGRLSWHTPITSNLIGAQGPRGVLP